MNKELIHINPSRIHNNFNILLLLIPIITFVLALTILAVTFNNNRTVLGETTSELDNSIQVTPEYSR